MRNQSILSQIASKQNIDGRNNSSKIKLPQLSFNALLAGSNDKILIQENFKQPPTLFAEHMLASSRSAQNLYKQMDVPRFPKVQLVRDSELTSTVESHF